MPIEGVRQPHFIPPGRQIPPMDSTHLFDLRPEALLQTVRKHRAPVSRSFPFTNDEEPSGKVDVLHPESQRLRGRVSFWQELARMFMLIACLRCLDDVIDKSNF